MQIANWKVQVETDVAYPYVTAAVSGTEYSGEWAASDLLVTYTFVVVFGWLVSHVTFILFC